MIWIHVSSVRKPRRWNSAGWGEDDRITSTVCLSCWLFESLNQGKVYEKPVAGVSSSSFLLRFSYYKSAVRNKCFACDLILCRHKHLGSTLWPDSLDCLESNRDLINSAWYKGRAPCSAITHPLSSQQPLRLILKENIGFGEAVGPWGFEGFSRAGQRWRMCGLKSVLEEKQAIALLISPPTSF